MEFGNPALFQMGSWKKRPYFPTSVLANDISAALLGSQLNSLENGLITSFGIDERKKLHENCGNSPSLPLN